MANRVWPVDAVAGSPLYSGRMLRQALMAPLAGGATAARPLGGRSGVRPGTPTNTVTATSTLWTVKPHAGMLDLETAAEAGVYGYAIDANVTGAVTAANATNPRVDIVYVQLDDPAESDGSSAPAVTPKYLAGTAAASPAPPITPARSMVLAQINVPASGGGAPSVTWVAPYAVAAGGIIPVRTTTERDQLNAQANADAPIYADVAGSLQRGNGTDWIPVSGGPLAQVTKSSAQNTSISAGNAATIQFNTEVFDTHGMHDVATNNTRLTAVVPGYYMITGKAAVAVTGLGYTSLTIAKNGASIGHSTATEGPATGGFTRADTSLVVPLNTGDYVELLIAISAGANAIAVGDCFFQAVFLRGL